MKTSSHHFATPARRDVLFGLGAGLGSVALSSLLHGADAALKVVHHPARAKRCIFLMMEGGPSHIDTFDPKPELTKRHLKKFTRSGDMQSAMSSGERYFVKSPFDFIKAGQSGADMCTEWQHLKNVADDLCFYRGCQVESVNHPTACYHVNTGNRFGGDPAVGSWVTYGLGSMNENLPGFVVLPRSSYPQGGAANWANGFLPAAYQGTPLRPEGSPILDLNPPPGTTRERQRKNLDLLAELNQSHLEKRPGRSELEARMSSYELAYRMQMEVPGILDLEGEKPATLEAYGIGDSKTDSFGRKCLLARRLVEKGVRFVQAYAGNWDSHDYIHKAHGALIRAVDQPIAALIADLKQRGMLDDTLVVWGGEFGRTTYSQGKLEATNHGRDHHGRCFTMWLAGGGIKPGTVHGETDDFCFNVARDPVHVHDLNATLLHQLGIDHTKLTYRSQGRDYRLTDVHGSVVRALIA